MSERSSTANMVRRLHLFTLEKYSLCKGIGSEEAIYSDVFTVGGYQWAFSYSLDWMPCGTTKKAQVYIGLHITLMSEDKRVPCLFKITLVDQSGEGKHRTMSLFDNVAPILLGTRQSIGIPQFIARDELDKSCYLKDDCLKIECSLGIVLPYKIQSVGTRKCDNVAVAVDFPIIDNLEIVIRDVEPQVFKALVHFLYTNRFPEDEKCLASGYAFGPMAAKLFAAAHKYDIRSLKLICECHIWNSISLNRFAETIALSEMYSACVLKDLCFEYAVDNFAALKELGSFTYLEKNYQLLFNELDDYLSKNKRLTKKEAPFTSGWLYLVKEAPLSG